MNYRRVTPPGAFLSLLVLLCIALIWQPAQAQAPLDESWQVFTEPALGFEIQYPSGWHVSLAADNTNRVALYGEDVALRSIGFFGPQSQMVFIDVWVNRSQKSLTEWLAAYPAPGSESPNIRQTNEPAQVAGQLARRQVDLPVNGSQQAPRHYRTQFAHQDLIFNLEYATLNPDLDLYQHMLNSFRHLEPSKNRLAPSTLTNVLPPAEFGVQVATCCNVTDPEFNPFPCNTAGDDSCPLPPCGNCTWWVRYRRTGSSDANLIRCTNDALTWGSCANQYYPHLVSIFPDDEAVVVYPGINHLSFVERANGASSAQVSDLSWFAPCPALNYTINANNKTFIHNSDTFVPNAPPNPPLLKEPGTDVWLTDRDLTLEWENGGDPDDGPLENPQYFAFIEDDEDGVSWDKKSGWRTKATWEVEVPEDGRYIWRVKAHDGMLESGWSTPREFGVDTGPPTVTFPTGQLLVNRWYRTEQTLSWRARDGERGAGIDYVKWDWDDDTPDQKVDDDDGTVRLSSAGQGVHNLYVRAWDKAGHASSTAALGWFGFDSRPPVISFKPDNPAPGQWTNQPPILGWTIADPTPGIGFSTVDWVWDNEVALRHNLAGHRAAQAAGSAALPPIQGKHALHLWAWDKLGNVSNIATTPWYGYDSANPHPPAIEPGCQADNSQWQNTCHTPAFSWSADDPFGVSGAGVSGYRFSWGPTTTTDALNGAWDPATDFTPAPVAPADGWGQGYFHVQAQDQAGNISSPSTFGLWYDGTLPNVEFSITPNGSNPTVQLAITATDSGSGPVEMRIANNDLVWSGWQAIEPAIGWTLAVTNNPTHTISLQVRDRAGNESAVAHQTLVATVDPVPLAVLGDGPTIPQPDEFSIALADGSFYTNVPTSSVTLAAPNAVTMRLSPNPTFVDSGWVAYQPDAPWQLSGTGQTPDPETVYVWFRDAAGSIYGPFFDTTVLDTVVPKARLKILSRDAANLSLYLHAWDDNSGISEMRFAGDPSMAGATSWEPYQASVTKAHHNSVLYVQVRDRAGNHSPIYGSDGSNSSLTEKRYLPLIAR